MQVFKSACKIILRHPIYLLVYIVLLSFLGVFLMSSLFSKETTVEYQADRPTIAIIDHDQSILSQELEKVLAQHAELVTIEDNKQALQDTVAQGVASYILIIPKGYSETFMEATGQEAAMPELDTVVSYASVHGALADQITNQYLSLVYTLAVAEPDRSLAETTSQAAKAMESTAKVELITAGDALPIPAAYLAFLKFSAYPLTAGIIVCVALMMGAFNRGEIRRRTIASPLSNASFNAQTALGCLVVALFGWVWINVLGLAVFGSMLEAVPWENIALLFLAILAFVMVPLSLGYLFSQIGLRENAINAAGNMLALVIAFLGGIWIDLSFLSEEIVAVSRFTPAYWYSDALTKISELTTVPSADILWSIMGDLGIVLLFAVATFIVALVVGRMRLQSAEAGGNTAASRIRV